MNVDLLERLTSDYANYLPRGYLGVPLGVIFALSVVALCLYVALLIRGFVANPKRWLWEFSGVPHFRAVFIFFLSAYGIYRARWKIWMAMTWKRHWRRVQPHPRDQLRRVILSPEGKLTFISQATRDAIDKARGIKQHEGAG